MMTSTEIDPMSILIIIFFIGWVIISYISEKMREKEFENKMRIEREKEEGKELEELRIEKFFKPLLKEYIESTQLDNYRIMQVLSDTMRGRMREINNLTFRYYYNIIREYLISESYKIIYNGGLPYDVLSETYTIDIVEKRKRKIEKLKNNIENKYNFK